MKIWLKFAYLKKKWYKLPILSLNLILLFSFLYLRVYFIVFYHKIFILLYFTIKLYFIILKYKTDSLNHFIA